MVNLEKLILRYGLFAERDAFKLIKDVKENCLNIIYFVLFPVASNWGFATKYSDFCCDNDNNMLYDSPFDNSYDFIWRIKN